MEQATGYSEGGGEGEKKFPAPPAAQTAPAAGNAPAPEEKKVDDFGYEVDPKKADEKPAEKSAKPKVDDKKPQEGDAKPPLGYDEEPPEAPAEKKQPDPKADEKPADKSVEEFEAKDPGDLLQTEIQEIKEFVKAHKLGKEVGQAMVEAKKLEVKKLKDFAEQQKKTVEAEVAKTKRAWYQELKADPTFGGEKFDYNVKRARKVVDEFMPNIKKMLTETKSMLPPYVMRDLVALADHLYDTDKLVQGEPITEKPSAKEEDDPLAYYQ